MTYPFNNLVLLLFFLQVKHLFLDFLLQPKWMWANKGTYGHPGGVAHAGLAGLGTALCFYTVLPFSMCVLVFLIDFILHYHIDWVKMNVNRIAEWKADTHPEFWWLLGYDQFLHQITYLFLIYTFLL